MNELLQKVRARLAVWKRSVVTFWQSNRMLALGGLTIVSILLIVWARLGFSFDFSRFYAAPSPAGLTVTCAGNQASLTWTVPGNAIQNVLQKSVNGGAFQEISSDAGTRSYTDTFTPTTTYRVKTGPAVESNYVSCPSGPVVPGTASVQCGTTQNVVTWTQGQNVNSNGLQRGNSGAKNLTECADYWCWLPNSTYPHSFPTASVPGTYTDTQLQPGTCYAYRAKYDPAQPSGEVFCPPGCNAAPTLCSIQGSKVHRVTPTDLRPFPAGDTITLSGTASNTATTNPYSFTGLAAGQYTVSAPQKAGFTLLGYTTCTEGQGCNATTHNAQPTAGSSATVACTPGKTVSVWWQYEAVAAPTPLSCTPVTQNTASGVRSGPITASGAVLPPNATGTYAWSVPAAYQGALSSTTGTSVTILYTNTSSASVSIPVTVRFGDQPPATCNVVVAAGAVTTVPTPLQCAPASQTIAVGQEADFQAAGGNSPYEWSAPGGSPSSGTGSRFETTYSNTGTYTVEVGDNAGTATAQAIRAASCRVVVEPSACVPEGQEVGPTQECCEGLRQVAETIPDVDIVRFVCSRATPTPAPASMTLATSGRNFSTGSAEDTTVTTLCSQEVEVVNRLTNTSPDVIANNVLIRVSLPEGIAYVNGSTTIGNAPTSVDSIAAGGLSLGSLGPLQEVVVRFRARVNCATLPPNQSQALITVGVSADGVSDLSGGVTVVVSRPAAGVPATVPTGPGEAVLVAFLMSAIMTLLYVSYTHSPAFRRREAGRVSEDQGPLDFRS